MAALPDASLGISEADSIAIVFQAEGKKVRLGTREKWLRAVRSGDLVGDTPVTVERFGLVVATCLASDVPHLRDLLPEPSPEAQETPEASEPLAEPAVPPARGATVYVRGDPPAKRDPPAPGEPHRVYLRGPLPDGRTVQGPAAGRTQASPGPAAPVPEATPIISALAGLQGGAPPSRPPAPPLSPLPASVERINAAPGPNLFFGFEGRVGRRQFWIGVGVTVVAGLLLTAIVSAMFGWTGESEGRAFWLIAAWPLAAISAKRCHDRGHSAYWLFLGLIPYLGWLWWLVNLGFLDGDPRLNRFGPATWVGR